MARPRMVPIGDSSLIVPQGSNPAGFHVLGSQILFTANDGSHGAELWRTDGTAAGTVLLKDITPGVDSAYATFVGNIGNTAMFYVYGNGSTSLWRTDGTTAGTFQVMAVPPPPAPLNGAQVKFIAADTRVFVLVRPSYDAPTEIWIADNTVEGTRRIATQQIEFSPTPLGVNGMLYFVARDASVGQQLWKSDGTLLGTHMVLRSVECPGASCGPVPGSFFRLGDRAFFNTATALWTTDGTAAGTVQLAAMPNAYARATSTTVAWLSAGTRLWVTDGTAGGTREIGTFAWQSADQPHVLSDGRLAILRLGSSIHELWISVPSGMAKKVTISFLGYSPYGYPVAWLGDRLFLPAHSGAAGTELWTADPVAGTATLVSDLDPRRLTSPVSSFPGPGIAVGTRVFFAASDIGGRELWESDGTAAGTRRLANIAPDPPGGGALSGTVRDAATGNPIANATVRLCPSQCEDSARTDANGQFRFDGVIPRSYLVSTSRQDYLTQTYDRITYPATGATWVQVTSGFETAGVDFSLVKGGTITGTVRRAATGEAYSSTILIRDSTGAVVNQTASVPDTGRYTSTLALPTGNYFVETRTSTFFRPAVDQVYQNHNCPPDGCSGVTGDAVSVTNGVETPNIDFSLRDWGTIAGTIRDASGLRTIQDARIDFVRAGSISSSATAYSQADGTYLSPLLNPGSYYLRIYGPHGYDSRLYPNLPCVGFGCSTSGGTAVEVAMDGAVTGIDAVLGQPKARLIGLVKDRNGAPLARARVSLLDSEGYYVSNIGYGSSFETGSNGAFMIFDIVPGTYYFKAEDEVYPNVDCFDTQCEGHLAGATPLVLSAGQTTYIETQLRSQRTTISGRIVDAVSGLPVNGQAQLLNASGTSLVSNSGSSFEVSVISRETTFYLAASEDGYHSIAYPNVRRNCQPYVACPIPAGATPFAAGTHAGIDMALQRFGAISGTVYDTTTGKPLRSTQVNFKSITGAIGSALTDQNGNYYWQQGDGAYYVYATHGPYQGQVYPNRNCTSTCVPETGDLIVVADGGEVAGIDFYLTPLTPTGKITGRVVDDVTGAGVANVSVTARNPNGYDTNTRTDAQGYYELAYTDSFRGMISGQYRLYASPPNPYFVALYGGGYCADINTNCDRYSGVPVQVTAPGTTANVDFRLLKLRVTAVTPAAGPPSGGTRATIAGANFPPGATVKIGGQAASIVSVTPTQIVIDTPAGAAGRAHVTVQASPSIVVTLTHGFTYFTPLAFTFTDDPVVAGTVVKAVHITELRSAVNAIRAIGGLPPYPFSDAVPSLVRAAHILELRTALAQARTALGFAPLSYANALTAGTPIRAIDINELRAGVRF